MRRALQVLIALFGAIAMVIAMIHIVAGPASIPGSVPVNATMDSEDRFYATLFLAYGAALLWCVRGIEGKAKVVYFLMLTFFIGGLARIISMLDVGPPNAFFVAMTAIELILPFVLSFMQFRVTNAQPQADPAAHAR